MSTRGIKRTSLTTLILNGLTVAILFLLAVNYIGEYSSAQQTPELFVRQQMSFGKAIVCTGAGSASYIGGSFLRSEERGWMAFAIERGRYRMFKKAEEALDEQFGCRIEENFTAVLVKPLRGFEDVLKVEIFQTKNSSFRTRYVVPVTAGIVILQKDKRLK